MLSPNHVGHAQGLLSFQAACQSLSNRSARFHRPFRKHLCRLCAPTGPGVHVKSRSGSCVILQFCRSMRRASCQCCLGPFWLHGRAVRSRPGMTSKGISCTELRVRGSQILRLAKGNIPLAKRTIFSAPHLRGCDWQQGMLQVSPCNALRAALCAMDLVR